MQSRMGKDKRKQTNTENVEQKIGVPHENERLRRTPDEIKSLVVSLKQYIKDSPDLEFRSSYFWKSEEAQDRLLTVLAADIAKGQSPLESDIVDNPTKSFESTYVESLCVQWIGLSSKRTRAAAIKVELPGTYESWITYANRIIVFLFGDIPGFENVDDFNTLTKANDDKPFKMLCKNPMCVKLEHIDYEVRIKQHTKMTSYGQTSYGQTSYGQTSYGRQSTYQKYNTGTENTEYTDDYDDGETYIREY